MTVAVRPRFELTSHNKAFITRWLVRAGLFLSAALLVINLGKFLHFTWFEVNYPYGLDYGEGIVWQQMRNIVAGQGYGPLGVYPAIVYHYPPVYHLTSAGLAALTGLDQLMAGRLVSLLSAGAMMVLVGLLTASALPRDEGRITRILAGTTAGSFLASTPEVVNWAAMMRVDMLSTALGLAGLLVVVRAPERSWTIPMAAIAFVLAIYTKQTSIAAPAAAFIGLWLARPRAAWALLIWCMAMGLAALAVLSLMTQGGFLQHIVKYNINRLDLSRVQPLLFCFLTLLVCLIAAGIGVMSACRRLRSRDLAHLRHRLAADRSLLALLTILISLAIKILMLPMMLKSGAADNYLIEWICALAMFVGIGMVPAFRIAQGENAPISAVLLAIVIAGLPLELSKVEDGTPGAAAVRHKEQKMAGLVVRIRASSKPVISDDMVVLIRAGQPVRWEPAIAAELAHGGRYDDRAFAAMVRRRAFGFFISEGERGDSLFDQRYDPVVADAMDAAYPVKMRISGETLHLPPR